MKIIVILAFAMTACGSAPEGVSTGYQQGSHWSNQVRKDLILCWKTENPDACAIQKGIAI